MYVWPETGFRGETGNVLFCLGTTPQGHPSDSGEGGEEERAGEDSGLPLNFLMRT